MVAVALAFCGWLWWYLNARFGRELADAKAIEYLTGYLIEKSLAVDNVFVWIILFSFFAVPTEFQKRVLLYGVVGAMPSATPKPGTVKSRRMRKLESSIDLKHPSLHFRKVGRFRSSQLGRWPASGAVVPS